MNTHVAFLLSRPEFPTLKLNIHISTSIYIAPSNCITFMQHCSFQDVAVRGCSNAHRAPRLCCQVNTAMQNSKGCLPVHSVSVKSVLYWLMYCHALKAVHGGENMMNDGNSRSNTSMQCRCPDFVVRSKPVSRSTAQVPDNPKARATFVSRGGLNISNTFDFTFRCEALNTLLTVRLIFLLMH